jgi:hypothetical protein
MKLIERLTTEKQFDLNMRGVYTAISETSPKRASHLSPGETLSMRAIVNDDVKKGWTLVDTPNGGKVNLTQSVKVTNIKKTPQTITITGEITVKGRNSITKRTVRKRLKPSTTLAVER